MIDIGVNSRSSRLEGLEAGPPSRAAAGVSRFEGARAKPRVADAGEASGKAIPGRASKSRAALGVALVAAAAAIVPMAARARELVDPVGVFVEGGLSDDSRSLVVGAAWTWVQPSRWGAGNASGYLETSIGGWACRRDAGTGYRGCSTQVGLTPVLRYEPAGWAHWYMELGIGADLIAPAWRTDKRRFSTEFNFGDHLGLGRKFGDDGADEIELRAEHYSNGGYKRPNPGENWFQLRYMHWFR